MGTLRFGLDIRRELAAIRVAEMSHPARDGRRVLREARMRLEVAILALKRGQVDQADVDEACEDAWRTRLDWARVGA